MRMLYHLPLDPFCRKVRLALGEKQLDARLIEEEPWARRDEFVALNHAIEIPVLVDEDAAGKRVVLAESTAIVEYLDETYEGARLMPGTAPARAETRRLMAWFDIKFEADVNAPLLRERIDKRLRGDGAPNIDRIRSGIDALAYHMDYLDWLAETRDWLIGERLTMADLTAAAHVSCIDYLGEIRWRDFRHAKDWYARVKSRPSFRALLRDRAKGVAAARHYDDLDF